MNDHDEVVGTYTVGTGSSAVMHGFTWKAGQGFTTVDDPHGVGTTMINGVNNAGDLVGSPALRAEAEPVPMAGRSPGRTGNRGGPRFTAAVASGALALAGTTLAFAGAASAARAARSWRLRSFSFAYRPPRA